MTTVDEEVEDAQVKLPSPAVHHAPAVAATTCRVQWRRDARVLGPPPLRTVGSLGLPPLVVSPTLGREYLISVTSGSWVAFSLGCQPGSYESAPCVTWAVLGSPPLQHCPPLPGGRRPLTHSPRREVVSGPAHTRGAHPAASGRLEKVVLFRQSYPALTNGGVVDAVVPCGP